jgi:trans-aconitate methyltransferase
MNSNQAPLLRMMTLAKTYDALYESYLRRGIDYTLDPNDEENNFDAHWKLTHYMETGADALRLCVGALISNVRTVPKVIVDLPSGSGRVTRHFKSYFQDARIIASDLYEPRWSFCANAFGVEGIQSTENFDDLSFDAPIDLLFAGSLLTHLPEPIFRSFFKFLSRSLSDTGIAVVTTQGRHAEWIQHNKYEYIEADRFAMAEKDVLATGFGYVDYNAHWMDTVWVNQKNYGVALARPWFTLKVIEEDYDLRILGYVERGFDNSQDAIIVGKPGVNAS